MSDFQIILEPTEISVTVTTSTAPRGAEVVAAITAELGSAGWQSGGGGGHISVEAGEDLSALKVVKLANDVATLLTRWKPRQGRFWGSL